MHPVPRKAWRVRWDRRRGSVGTGTGQDGSVWYRHRPAPDHLPPILKRLAMRPEQYLAYVKKSKFGFANALGALDKRKAYAEHFEKAFLKGQTAAAALFSACP